VTKTDRLGKARPEASRVAIATTSGIAARAGGELVEAGGNAVDAALAATLVTMSTEPGVCSLGCGGFITVWHPGERPVTIDGWVAAPSQRTDRELAWDELAMDYGGGMTTIVGPASVGIPGGVSALGEASRRFGRMPWNTLFEPAIAISRSGFPLPAACHSYLVYSAEPLFSRSPDGHRALHDAKGRLLRAGDTVRIPCLADTLERVARKGPDEFYSGDLGRTIAQHIEGRGGRLTHADLARYRPDVHDALLTTLGDWEIATTPPPAIGGAAFAAMLRLAETDRPRSERSRVANNAAAQHAVLSFRHDRLDCSDDVPRDVEELLRLADGQDFRSLLQSPSTVHTSATDSNGLACAVTMSSGYGSGETPDGTGVWLNNCLGELELNRSGVEFGPPGARLPSNMAPSTARHADGRVLAVGSPGADRITTALMQVMLNIMRDDMTVDQAVSYPRVHVERRDEIWQLAHESGADIRDIDMPTREFPNHSMFFGGVGAVMLDSEGTFAVAADPRRTGGVWQTPR
jgi:gamma-glutamyltranspeptidase/glutathione hydrolase